MIRLLAPGPAAAHPAVVAGNILDVREPAAFRAGHAAGAASWPLPAAEGLHDDVLAAWLPGHRLPPRHEPLLVVGPDSDTTRRLVEFLRRGGRLADGTVWCAELAAALPRETGPGRTSLWRPAPFLVDQAGLLPPPAAGPVLDCGSGSGRNAVWLARRGYAVTVVDRDPEALRRARELAAEEGVRLTSLVRDLSDPAQVPAGPWALLLAIRYLERPLLRRAPQLLRPGGVVLVRTFRWVPSAAERLPRRRFCLEPGELPALLPSPPFTHLHLAEDDDPDGRPAAGIVARLGA